MKDWCTLLCGRRVYTSHCMFTEIQSHNVYALIQAVHMDVYTHTHSQTHTIVSIMAPTDGRITKALVVKGQILP